MAQYKITKQVNFGNFTITGPSGLQSDKVSINNYAPKVGDVIEGNLVTKPINDGNGHTVVKTGIVWTIMTNGAASTQGQTSIQFISQDHFEVPVPESGDDDNTNPHPTDPINNVNPSSDNTTSTTGQAICWICDNKIPVLMAILIIVGLVLILNND